MAAASAEADEPHDGSWELRVCSQPHNFPMSSRDRPGFENRIAEILADELGARLTYLWTPFDDATVQRTLHRGECDVVVGIGESVSGVVSTVSFLRAPYTFVSRADRDIDVTSLDDPSLADLSVGTYQTGIPSIALRNRGLEGILREYAPVPSPSGPDRHTAILDAVVDGDVDIAIVYGPHAAARALDEPGTLRIEPVTPETDLGDSIIQLFRIWTVGVRPGDVPFRERLNAAMAARWDDIQSAIDAYGVDGLDIPRPVAGPNVDDDMVRIGVVLPMQTLDRHAFDDVGEAARRGVHLAENYVATHVDRDDVPFEVLIASAPSDASAVRAAERLIATEGVAMVAGGFGATQGQSLARIANDRDVVFFNIGSNDDRLRDAVCSPMSFHIAASASMYADAALAWHGAAEATSWYLVVDEELHGERFMDRFVERVEDVVPNGVIAGVARTQPRQFMFLKEIRAIRDADPDAVLVALGPEDEDQFLAQFEGQGIDAIVTAVPHLRSQTRRFLQRFRQAAPQASLTARPVMWDATLLAYGADDINDGYASRNGEPMEGASWSGYTAVRIAFAAAEAGTAADAESLVTWLGRSDTTFDVGKGPGVSFRPWDQQLRQPLAMIRVDAEAPWGNRLTPRVELAQVEGLVPDSGSDEDPVQVLDRIGRMPESSRCSD